MFGKIALLLLAFQSSLMPPVVSGASRPEDLSVKLSKRVANYNLGMSNFVDALLHVSSDFQIPMGVVWVNTPAARAELAFAWKDATVQEIIEAIGKTQPGYGVRVRNGVLHVSPPALIPDQENFLTLKIKTFEVHNDYLEVASSKLHDLIKPRLGGTSIGLSGNEPRISLEMKDSTVEEIMDALVIASRRKIWVVTFSNDVNVTPTGFRRTMSLGSDAPSPDQWQPAWNLLHWGDKINWAVPAR